VLGAVALAAAFAYAAATLFSGGDMLLLLPLLAATAIVAVLAHPVVGVYALFGIGLLFEQLTIAGIEPITQTRLFQNISTYSPLPVPASGVDLLMLLTVVSAAMQRSRDATAWRVGAFGRPVLGYAAVFFVGTVIGIARGGDFQLDVALNELRGPLTLLILYLLATNILRDRGQLVVLLSIFMALTSVKALQAILNYGDAQSLPYALRAFSSHEDVVFFGAAAAIGLAACVLRVSSRLAWPLLAVQPLIWAAELLGNRRTGFVALGVTLSVIALLTLVATPRRGLIVVGAGVLGVAAFLALFWDASGPIADPIRALRSVFDPSSTSLVDQSSDAWRLIEDRNIAFTVQQLPLTGVGLGQQYLFQMEPSPLGFLNWRYIAHNALLWLWLKAGPLGALALWFLVARVLTISSAVYARLRDEEMRLALVLPITLLVSQVVFSSVDLGLTYMRTMMVLGIALGMASFLARRDAPIAAAVAPAR
jgi:hypothetical protein